MSQCYDRSLKVVFGVVEHDVALSITPWNRSTLVEWIVFCVMVLGIAY